MSSLILNRPLRAWPLALLLLGSVGLGLLLQSRSATEDAAARPQTSVTRLSCEPLAEVPGKVVSTLLVDFPPNAYTPAHRHSGAVSVFVVRGQVRSQMQGEPARLYPAGQSWFEPAGALHRFAENASAEQPAQVLATIISDEGCGPLVIPEPHAH
ncbi:cupin domain-containing protein [Pseudomonas citronellolis]|uniref:cupin domain-containing protein n=1 Tax=Pseudomonas citronellolis TaxID=53408 RepID=UPI0023E42DFB|nr:cupin domain-containing protein [Pseudomonas citronellolis]MDF3932789.1 cupin domain-containing protein [Pseudomonas citronellolis]